MHVVSHYMITSNVHGVYRYFKIPKISRLTGKTNFTNQISIYQKYLLVRLNYSGIIKDKTLSDLEELENSSIKTQDGNE